MNNKILISPSILSADFAQLGKEVAALEAAGADMIHVDVMDGHFVPNLTIGPPIVAAIRPHTKLPLDVHLMMENPQNYVEDFAKAGADIITVHAEALGKKLGNTLEKIRALGPRAGVSIKPSTLPDVVGHVMDHTDLILVMTVEPGFGGQKLLPECVDKVHKIRNWIDEYGHDIILQVDGGINEETIKDVAKAGANAFVAGSAIFKTSQYKENIMKLRKAI